MSSIATANRPGKTAGKGIGRPRKPRLYLAKSEWCARVTNEVEGTKVRTRWRSGTTNRAVALARLKAYLAGGAPSKPAVPSFAEAFELAAAATWDEQTFGATKRSMVLRWALPVLGDMPVDQVRAVHIRGIIEAVQASGLSAQTAAHVLASISGVLKWCWRQELVAENVALKVEKPRDKGTKRARAVLRDEELGAYLAWTHPEPCFRLGVQERQCMVAMSRCWGGVRAGDLVALDWRSLDSEGGAFTWGVAPRQKTKKPQMMVLPELVRPALRAWWQAHGCPSAGPVFPCLTGARAGETRLGLKAAGALRQDLARALGAETWDGKRWRKVPQAQLTPRLVELLYGTAEVARLDFHSCRRAFCTALAAANINAQQAQQLAGHSSIETHSRYLARAELLEVPAAALPHLSDRTVPEPRGQGEPTVRNSTGNGQAETCTWGEQLPAPCESSRAFSVAPPVAEHPRTPGSAMGGHKSWPQSVLALGLAVAAAPGALESFVSFAMARTA